MSMFEDSSAEALALYGEDDDDGGFPPEIDGGPICRGCGCSYTRPCPGGCVWATVDLCSACVRRGVT
jgi:hypothetical protein